VRAEVAQRELPRVARIGYARHAPARAGGRQRGGRPRAAGQVLTPLGFEVRQAASGLACLELLRGGDWAPDAILMDLAMPGIDGWETIRRMRAQALSAAPVAIVSANAFDQGLDNDVGIAPADFVLKPVRKAELLDWLGRALALEWLHAPLPACAAAPAAGAPGRRMACPDAAGCRRSSA
jgi:CheY-like chemotaxis protein